MEIFGEFLIGVFFPMAATLFVVLACLCMFIVGFSVLKRLRLEDVLHKTIMRHIEAEKFEREIAKSLIKEAEKRRGEKLQIIITQNKVIIVQNKVLNDTCKRIESEIKANHRNGN